MEENKRFFYLMTMDKTELIESVKKFKKSTGSIDLTYNTADCIVPPLLYNKIVFLVRDLSDPPVDSKTQNSLAECTRERVLNLTQDIFFPVLGACNSQTYCILCPFALQDQKQSFLSSFKHAGHCSKLYNLTQETDQ